MPTINLLPWREELRKQRQKNFGLAAALAFVLGAGVVFAAMKYTDGNIDYQNDRNKYLQGEIKVLDEQIVEIKNLESVRERLLARMQIIEELQSSRPEIVHLLDELARSIPEGVHLEALRQAGARVTIEGIAQSSTRVSALMRNIDRSEWLTDPGLEVVEKLDGAGASSRSFTIFARQTAPKSAAEGDE